MYFALTLLLCSVLNRRMKEKQDKLGRPRLGRPRRYALKPPAGFADSELAHAAAQLQELSERVCDQIVDLPADALEYTAQDAPLSITMLVLHMAWAEAWWVQRISGVKIPESLNTEIQKGSLSRIGEPPPTGFEAATLIAICRRVQSEYSQPRLAGIEDIAIAGKNQVRIVPNPLRPSLRISPGFDQLGSFCSSCRMTLLMTPMLQPVNASRPIPNGMRNAKPVAIASFLSHMSSLIIKESA